MDDISIVARVGVLIFVMAVTMILTILKINK